MFKHYGLNFKVKRSRRLQRRRRSPRMRNTLFGTLPGKGKRRRRR